ncbi:MAG: hypothetical protein V2A53_10080 [bacterium]
MQIIEAKILDTTHLELKQPISAQRGECIQVSIPDGREEDHLWQEMSKKHFLEAYDAQDAIYDNL